ncbi:MAG: adenylosuccinate lyase [Bacilli bacterium]|nr:adenylosuccinate lyase [Bacilli bacterium]
MIERYLPKKMKTLFSDEERFQAYLDVEIAVDEAWCELGIIPQEDIDKIKANAKVDVNRINELELITKHDVVAFTRQISETLGEEKRWIHYGLTSTDVVDTALSLLYKKANDIIKEDILNLISKVKDKALEYKYTPCIGRTHGMHGEVISFGVKWANYYDELNRGLEDFENARKYVEAAKLSGAMGNYANIDPHVQDIVANKLGLTSANISTQVLARDRHERYACALAILASTYEKIATEIRNLSRSEIVEVEEGFAKGQKGSSAMPQKRNPISTENVTGCVRMIRGYLLPILEDNALYSERDISHSSVERVSLIDMIELFSYTTDRLARVVDNLVVFPKNMLRNIMCTNGAIYAQRVLTRLIEKGLARETAYDTIQPLAMKAIQEGMPFKDSLANNELVMSHLSKDELENCFSNDYYLKNTDFIYDRLGLK